MNCGYGLTFRNMEVLLVDITVWWHRRVAVMAGGRVARLGDQGHGLRSIKEKCVM